MNKTLALIVVAVIMAGCVTLPDAAQPERTPAEIVLDIYDAARAAQAHAHAWQAAREADDTREVLRRSLLLATEATRLAALLDELSGYVR